MLPGRGLIRVALLQVLGTCTRGDDACVTSADRSGQCPNSFRYIVNGEGSLGKRFTPPPFVPTHIPRSRSSSKESASLLFRLAGSPGSLRYLVNRRRARSNLTTPSGFVASHSIPCWSSWIAEHPRVPGVPGHPSNHTYLVNTPVFGSSDARPPPRVALTQSIPERSSNIRSNGANGGC
jgi:hypothetical protein